MTSNYEPVIISTALFANKDFMLSVTYLIFMFYILYKQYVYSLKNIHFLVSINFLLKNKTSDI